MPDFSWTPQRGVTPRGRWVTEVPSKYLLTRIFRAVTVSARNMLPYVKNSLPRHSSLFTPGYDYSRPSVVALEHEMAVGFSIEHGIAVGLADGMHRKWSSWEYFCLLFTRFCVQLSVTLLPRLHRRGISRSLVQNYSGCQGARGCIPGSFFLRHRCRFILSQRTPNFVSVPHDFQRLCLLPVYSFVA